MLTIAGVVRLFRSRAAIVIQQAEADHLVRPDSVGAIPALRDRLVLFGITDDDLRLAKVIWAAIEPEADAIADALWRQWRCCLPDQQVAALAADDWSTEAGVTYLRNRYTATGGPDWVRAAERTVAEAFSAGLDLSSLNSMLCVVASYTLEILSRWIEHADEQQRVHEAFQRLRSLEGDVFASLYTACIDHDARRQRDQLADEFRDGIARLVESASDEGSGLRQQARNSAMAPAASSTWPEMSPPPPSSRPSRCARRRRRPPG